MQTGDKEWDVDAFIRCEYFFSGEHLEEMPHRSDAHAGWLTQVQLHNVWGLDHHREPDVYNLHHPSCRMNPVRQEKPLRSLR